MKPILILWFALACGAQPALPVKPAVVAASTQAAPVTTNDVTVAWSANGNGTNTHYRIFLFTGTNWDEVDDVLECQYTFCVPSTNSILCKVSATQDLPMP